MDQSLLELLATSFIAGFTIVFGILSLGLLTAAFGHLPRSAAEAIGAVGLGVGMIYLVVGRAELFAENFFDPVATLFQRRNATLIPRVARLWSITFILNIAGGLVLCAAVAVPSTVPPEARHALVRVAEHVADRGPWAIFMSAVVGGALIALLSHLLQGAQSVGTRAALAFTVGFVLALGPFDHAVVTLLHLAFGLFFDATVGMEDLATVGALNILGNLVGGIGLVTLGHVAQAKGAEEG